MRPSVPPPLVTHGRARLNETWRLIDAPKGRTTCQVRWAALAHMVQLSADKRTPGRSQMLMLHWQAASECPCLARLHSHMSAASI